MAFRVAAFNDFHRGVWASFNRFSVPQAAVLRASNLVLTTRGALKVSDGDHVISSGITNRIAAISRFNPTGGAAILVALAVSGTGSVQLWNINGATATAILAAALTGASQTPNMTQMLGSLMLALGSAAPLQVYTSGTAAAAITNADFVGTNIYPPWSANTAFPPNAIVTAVVATVTYLFQTVNGGFTGATAPAFSATFGSTVVDNGVAWQNVGPSAAPAPPGAGFVFYHLGFPWIWGTSQAYTASGIDGPDALRMGGLGDVNYWDPTFMAFIGKNDGQLPQGGALFTLTESGIPATAQLVLFKTKDTYQVLGAFPQVQIVKVPTGVGCLAPGTIQFVPGLGIIRLSNYGVALFDGSNDVVDQFTDPIRPYLFGGASDITPVDWSNIQNASSTQSINPPGYLMLCPLVGSGGANTRGFFFDRFLQAWTVLDFPFSLAGGGFITQEQAQSQTLIGGFSDGNVRQFFSGDTAWDTGAINWSLRTPPVGPSSTPMFSRRLNLRISSSAVKNILISANYDTTNSRGQQFRTKVQVLNTDSLGATVSLDIGVKALGGAFLDVSGTGPATIEGLELQYVEQPPGRIGF